jgi:hypothetical protein
MTTTRAARDLRAAVPRPAPPVYGAGSIRRRRRTRAEMEAIREAIVDVLAEDHPMTVRGVFYRMVGTGLVEKTEGEYSRTIGRLVLELRREGVVPYSWIADGTRWTIKPETFGDVDQAMEDMASSYRRALWHDQEVYVEVWTEKDAIAGILHEVTEPWDVPLMVARGFASESFLWTSAQEIRRQRKPAYLYHFGDHDPSGVAAAEDIERRLRGFAAEADITFVRVAVTTAQIARWDLPTRPTKRNGNPHARNFQGGSVEVDAIPPSQLRALAEECITRHINRDAHQATLRVEREERAWLESWMNTRDA